MKKHQNQEQNLPNNKIYYDQKYFYNMAEREVDNWLDNPSNHFKIEKAKLGGWLGYKANINDQRGLLAYLRTNFRVQIKIAYNLGNCVPIFQSNFKTYFDSSFFKDEVLKNGISDHLIMEKHIESIGELPYQKN